MSGTSLLATFAGLAAPAVAATGPSALSVAPRAQVATSGAPVPGSIDVAQVANEVDPAVVDVDTTVDALKVEVRRRGRGCWSPRQARS